MKLLSEYLDYLKSCSDNDDYFEINGKESRDLLIYINTLKEEAEMQHINHIKAVEKIYKITQQLEEQKEINKQHQEINGNLRKIINEALKYLNELNEIDKKWNKDYKEKYNFNKKMVSILKGDSNE